MQDRAHTWFNVRDNKPIPAVPPTVLTVPVPADGAWRVELWDTEKGVVVSSTTVQAKGGHAEVALPAIEKDVALKLIRQ